MGDGKDIWATATDVQPVTKAVAPKPVPDNIDPIWNTAKNVTPVNIATPNVSVGNSQALLTQSQGHGDAQLLQADIAQGKGDITSDQKEWLYDNKNKLTPEQYDHSLNVYSNKAADQGFWNKGEYYYDKNGLPQVLKAGDAAPEYATVASIFGSQKSAEDDSAWTTFGKEAWNGVFGGTANTLGTVSNLVGNLFGADSTDVGDWLKSTSKAIEFKERTSEDVTSAKTFQSTSDFLNSDNWKFSTQSIAKFFGSAIGFLGQLAVGGGLVKSVGAFGEGLSGVEKVVGATSEATDVAATALSEIPKGESLVSKLLPSGQLVATNALVSLNSAYDQASAAGLKGRERAGMSLISAMAQGYIMSIFAPSALKNVAGGVIKEGTDVISRDAVDAFIKAGDGKITSESLAAAYNKTILGTLKFAQKLPVIAREGLKGGTMMVGSQLANDAVGAIDAKITGKVQPDETSADTFKKYFDSFFSGAVLGIGGSLVDRTATKEDAQSNMAYAYIKDGKSADLLHNIQSLYDNKAISQQDYDNANLRVASYKKYFAETADVSLDDVAKRKVFDLTWTDENLKQQITTLEGDETMTPAIKEGKLKILREQSKAKVDEIAELMKPKAPEEVKTEQPVEKIVDKSAKTSTNTATQRMDSLLANIKKSKESEVRDLVAQKDALFEGKDTLPNEDAVTRHDEIAAKIRSFQTEDFTPEETVALKEKANAGDKVAQDKLDENKIEWKQEELKASAEKLTGEGEGKNKNDKKTDKEIRAKVVETVIGRTPELNGFKHELKDAQDLHTLVGDKSISPEDKLVRNKLEVGDVLTVKKNPSTKKGYRHFLNAYAENDSQVGSIDYKSNSRNDGSFSDQDKFISDELEKGNEVRLVVTKAKKVNTGRSVFDENGKRTWIGTKEGVKEIHYQVITRDKNFKEEPTAKAEYAKPVEKIVNKKEETATPVESQKVEKPVENAKKDNPVKRNQEILKQIKRHEPTTFRQKVMQDILTSDKPLIKSADYIHETGFGAKDEKGKFIRGGKEYQQAKKNGFHGDKGSSLDSYVSNDFYNNDGGVFGDASDTGEAKQVVMDVMNEYGDENGRARMRLDLLDEMYKGTEKGMQDAELMSRFGTTDEAEIEEIIKKQNQENPEELDKVETLEDYEKYAEDNKNYGTWVDEQADEFIEGLNEATDNEEGQGKTGEEEVAFPADADPNELLKESTGSDWETDFLPIVQFARNKGVDMKKFMNSAFNKWTENSKEIKYQDEAPKEPLATSDPVLFDKIVTDLKAKFPNVTVFTDAKKFQEFLDKNFPGAKLDLTKIGAAIANAVYIDPQRARQSTALHEFAHIYWDMLPKNDATKKKLLELFPDEESAIRAIGEVGTNAKNIKLKGTALGNFLRSVKEFFGKVKEMFFPKKMTLEEQQKEFAKVMADRVFANAERVDATEQGAQGPVKYMEDDSNDKQKQVVRDLQSIADEFDFNADEHTYTNKATGEKFPSVTEVMDADPKYKYSGPTGAKREALKATGKSIHSIVENIIQGSDDKTTEDAIKKTIEDSGLNIHPTALKSLVAQLKSVIGGLKKQGQLLSETVFANTDFKLAGTSDLQVVHPDGTIDIYDVKTSMVTKNRKGYDEPMAAGKGTKRESHGAQLGLYAQLIESTDTVLGNEGQTVEKLGIIPIDYVEEDGVVTEVTVGKTIEFSKDDHKAEVDRLLNQHRQVMEDHDRSTLENMTESSEQEYLDSMGMNMQEMKDELKSVQELPFEKRGEREGELKRGIELLQDRQRDYKRDFKKVKDIVKTKDFSKTDHATLTDWYNTIMKYGNMKDNLYLRRVKEHIAMRMKDEQEKLLGEGRKAEPDIKKHQVLSRALSDTSDQNPTAQSVAKIKLIATREMESEQNSVIGRIHKLAKAVLSEKTKDTSILNRAAQLFRDQNAREGYFKNLYGKNENGQITLKDANDSSLSPKEKELVKAINEEMQPYEQKQKDSQRGWWQGFFPQATPVYWEAFHNEGLFGTTVGRLHANDPEALGEQKIDFIDPSTKQKVNIPYSEAVERLAKAKGKNIFTETVASLKLKQIHKRAIESFVKAGGTISESEGMKYFVSRTGEIMSKYQREFKGKENENLNPIRAVTDYLQDMIHAKHMQKVLPELESARMYYDDKAHVNMTKFLNMLKDGDILGKRYVGKLGAGADNVSRFLVGWTFLNQITFNLHSGVIHAFTRKWNQWRTDGGVKLIKGEGRYFANPKQSFGIMKHFDIVPKSATLDEMAGYNAQNLFTKIGVANISIGEHWVRGSSFFSNITDAEYKALQENFDNKGNIIDRSKKIFSQQRLVELDKQVNDVQGKYGFADKRMYKHYPLMRAGMQYRGYLPDFIKDRVGAQYTDAFGKVHKGSYRSATLPYIIRDVNMLFTDTRNFMKSKDINVINNKKNMREIASFAAVFGVYAMVNGKSPEEKKEGNMVMDALGHMAGIFNPQAWTFTAQQPIPSLATFANFSDAFTNLFARYASDGKYGRKGDLMAPGKFMNVLPYNHIVKNAYQSMANPNYKGQ